MIEKINDSKHLRYTSCHSYVTDFCHSHNVSLTDTHLKFIQKAFDINVIRGDLWSYIDFFPLSKDNFRKIVQRLRPIIEKVIPSNPALYQLKGITIPSVTINSRGISKKVSLDFESLLSTTNDSIPMMHNLHLRTFVRGLYDGLKQNPNFTLNTRNKTFTIRLNFNQRFPTTINVYSDKIHVMIGCTNQPLPYSIEGFLELSSHLGSVCVYLKAYAEQNFVHEPISNWIVTLYHFNKDGLIIDSPAFHYTINLLATHSFLYIKHFEDGTVRPRYEEHRTPHKSIAEMAKDVDGKQIIFNRLQTGTKTVKVRGAMADA